MMNKTDRSRNKNWNNSRAWCLCYTTWVNVLTIWMWKYDKASFTLPVVSRWWTCACSYAWLSSKLNRHRIICCLLTPHSNCMNFLVLQFQFGNSLWWVWLCPNAYFVAHPLVWFMCFRSWVMFLLCHIEFGIVSKGQLWCLLASFSISKFSSPFVVFKSLCPQTMAAKSTQSSSRKSSSFLFPEDIENLSALLE